MAVTVSDRLLTVGRGRDREGLMPAIAGRDRQGSNPPMRSDPMWPETGRLELLVEENGEFNVTIFHSLRGLAMPTSSSR
ncbi:hypothetical protein EMCRGX_G001664 [Ephydatia muelleri]